MRMKEDHMLNGFNRQEGFAFAAFTKVTNKNLYSLLEPTFKSRTQESIDAQNIKTKKQARAYYNDVYSAMCFTYPHDCWTKTVAAQGKPVYEYFFNKENGELGTMHSGEMIYAYRNVPKTRNYNQSDYDLEMIISSYWLNFVKYGDPNGLASDGKQLPKWKTFNESVLLLEFRENCRMREDPFNPIYEYLISQD